MERSSGNALNVVDSTGGWGGAAGEGTDRGAAWVLRAGEERGGWEGTGWAAAGRAWLGVGLARGGRLIRTAKRKAGGSRPGAAGMWGSAVTVSSSLFLGGEEGSSQKVSGLLRENKKKQEKREIRNSSVRPLKSIHPTSGERTRRETSYLLSGFRNWSWSWPTLSFHRLRLTSQRVDWPFRKKLGPSVGVE